MAGAGVLHCACCTGWVQFLAAEWTNMIISLINRSKTVTDEVAQTVVRAINRQITQDFAPYWSFGATLRLEGAIGEHPNLESLSDMRGDAVLYLVDGTNSIGAIDQVQYGVTAHVTQALEVRVLADGALQAQSRAKTPVRCEVLRNLAVNRPDNCLRHFIGDGFGTVDK